MPRTKIIATLGPASSSVSVIRKMMVRGLDVVRLNFSHGTHAGHKRCIESVRDLNRKYRRHIRVLQDLQGHRIRIGRFKGHRPIPLRKRQTVRITQRNILGTGNRFSFDYKGPLKAIKQGHSIFIDDGNIILAVSGRGAGYLKAEVVRGGLLRENKGVNIPEARLRFPPIAECDLRDIRFGLENKVDYIAQSFVRDRRDILRLKDAVGGMLPEPAIIAKIESREGIRNIDEIIDVSDGIMIARGDMGISVPLYEVPIIQKKIISKCKRRKRFVITATQMLESMTENIMPTRAEVSDVANAILDGTDFVMLSAETAAGSYPVEAVDMMNQVIKFTEKSSL